VFRVEELLPELPSGTGKGNAMWKSLYVCEGDLLCWVDADIRNFRADFVTRLLAPLLTDPDVGMVKGFYRRPLDDKPTGGGRVTELMARPVLSYLFPLLTRFVQPLAGEYSARRSILETVPFVEGWGVEIGLLLDVVHRFGIQSVSQVDLGVRAHRNRPLEQLGPQALAILATALRRAGIDACDPPFAAELVRYDENLAPERIPVVVHERPPIVTVPAYRAKFGREETA
jgi:glucosyl-3-phosphoglycerate synthase